MWSGANKAGIQVVLWVLKFLDPGQEHAGVTEGRMRLRDEG